MTVNDSDGKYLEVIYYNVLIKESVKCFSSYPYIYGLSGSTGELYLKRNKWLYNLLNYIGLYSVNSGWSKLLNFIKKCRGKNRVY